MRNCYRVALLFCTLALFAADSFAASKPKPLPRPRTGDVLIAGGIASDGKATASAEFYSASRKKFFSTGSMSTARAALQLLWMPQSPERTVNQAVAFGGFSGSAAINGISASSYDMNVLASAEVYNPATGTFQLDQSSDGDAMTTGRAFFAAIAFPGNLSTGFLQGHVLMIGGMCNAPDLESCRTANILHPDYDQITTTSNPKVPVMMETLTNLADGTALMTGGIDSFSGTITNTAELFTPPNEFFILLGAPMIQARAGHTATLLNDGTVLIAGGIADADGMMTALNSAEIYDPVSQTFSPVLAPMVAARAGHTANLLKDGRVLLAGGYNGTSQVALTGSVNGASLAWSNGSGTILKSAEIYDPQLKTFEPVGGVDKKTGLAASAMLSARYGHTATTLVSGQVLFTGGFGLDKTGATVPLKTAERFIPNKNRKTLGRFAKVGPMISSRALHAAALVEK